MKLIIVSREIYADAPFAIHAAGCADIERSERKRNGTHCFKAFDGTVEAAVSDILDAEMREMGYDESHVRVFPCCKAVR